jgi:hypothetical protein
VSRIESRIVFAKNGCPEFFSRILSLSRIPGFLIEGADGQYGDMI